MPRDQNTEDAEDLFSRGHQAYNGGDFREAIECFSRAIRLRPDVAAAYRFRAYAYLELGDRIRALNDLDQAIRLKPDDVQVYADRAAELYVQKAFDQALADCEKVLKLDPGRAPMYGLRARCHAERGDTESALKDYANAIEGDPENTSRYLLWRAQLHLECDNYAAADADVSDVIDREPGNPEGYYTRGTIRQQKGDAIQASEDFSAALRLKPDHAHARIGRAVCYLMHKDYPAVVADCDKAIELIPENVKSYELRGTARKAIGNLDGALADFNEAIKLVPTAVMPYNYRAGVHYARGHYGAAVRDHMEALKRDPRHAGTFNQLAWVWSTCPDPDVRNGLRARECATRACELTEWSEAGFLDTLAAAYAECGEFDDAVKWQEKAIELVGTPEQETDYHSRLELYQQRKPARVRGLMNP
ncbi:MAG TPA: tetratricopeptide repeat protein [Gemmata sp.]|jgi:serine/threonine-protein kinase|nr:tetratricopeptide repeat protein [Gemmata sp.]